MRPQQISVRSRTLHAAFESCRRDMHVQHVSRESRSVMNELCRVCLSPHQRQSYLIGWPARMPDDQRDVDNLLEGRHWAIARQAQQQICSGIVSCNLPCHIPESRWDCRQIFGVDEVCSTPTWPLSMSTPANSCSMPGVVNMCSLQTSVMRATIHVAASCSRALRHGVSSLQTSM